MRETFKVYGEAVRSSLASLADTETYCFIIDYDIDVSRLVFCCDLKNFPTQKKGVSNVTLKLIRPFFDFKGRILLPRESCERIYRMGYHPACIRETIAFSKKFPQEVPLLVLGSYLEGVKSPVLFGKKMRYIYPHLLQSLYAKYNFQIAVTK